MDWNRVIENWPMYAGTLTEDQMRKLIVLLFKELPDDVQCIMVSYLENMLAG